MARLNRLCNDYGLDTRKVTQLLNLTVSYQDVLTRLGQNPAADRHRGRRIGFRAIAQLAEEIVAPAFDRAARQQRARVHVTRRDRNRIRQPDHGDRRRRVTRSAVAQLPVGVEAPTLDGPVSEHRAGMRTTRRERHHTAEAGHGHRRRRVGQRAVAELAEEIATPALERPVRHRHTRMIATRRDRGLERPRAGQLRDGTRRHDMSHGADEDQHQRCATESD